MGGDFDKLFRAGEQEGSPPGFGGGQAGRPWATSLHIASERR